MVKKTLGGDRLGSGNKMKIELHGYERSTHDLGYPWRSTMAPGTLVPFIVELCLPGDTFDIDLEAFINTHPTLGPLFGSYKLQLDVFKADIRLYHRSLHNNALNVGRNMGAVKMPMATLYGHTVNQDTIDLDNAQVNPSCIWAYLGVRGVAYNTLSIPVARQFNAIPYLAYWDIYKNFYANKQEEIGAVIHSPKPDIFTTVTDILVNATSLPQAPTSAAVNFRNGDALGIDFAGTQPDPATIMVTIFVPNAVTISMADLASGPYDLQAPGQLRAEYDFARYGNMTGRYWNYIEPSNVGVVTPKVTTFQLSQIDQMRDNILGASSPTAVNINDWELDPYAYTCPITADPDYNPLIQTQEGLALKTYQSDLFNNWLSTEWVDGMTGLNEISKVSTAGGSFQIDQLYLANKIYQVMARIMVSGGSYDDWLDAVYDHDRFVKTEIPTYHGSLIKEIIFQEVISNSQATSDDGTQPLGTLAGKGKLSEHKHKGGRIRIKVDEPGYIIALASITPRIDYSQGNRWFTYSIITMEDLHKPGYDQIGFQDSATEQMAWWSTIWDGTNFHKFSYGKQTGWIHYQTNYARTYGNFAIENNEMFMTLNRRYEPEFGVTPLVKIKDLTTYIDPAKYNNIYAQTSLDAQNFWVQIGVGMEVRRKMSAKVMPNL